MKKILESRLNILIAAVVCIFGIFVFRLIDLQIINGDGYYSQSNRTTRINQSITASRGDISDANGVPLASSKTVFNVSINKAYMPNGKLNERIIAVLDILDQYGRQVNDILPMSTTLPYTFDESKDSELSRLRTTIKVAVYATEKDVLAKLVDRYSLEDVPESYQRRVAGVRYTMERLGYSDSFPFNIAEDVSVELATVIKEKSRELTGIEITTGSKRYYGNGSLLPHILGSVGPIYAEEYEELKSQGYGLNDILGKSGLEKSYESFLKGTDGIVQIEKDIYGGITDTDIIKEPVPGNTVQLTVDSDLQEQSNAILRDLVTFLQGRSAGWGKECDGASMVVLDTKTGGVLAMSNYPSYDLNSYSSNYQEYSENPSTPLFNRAFQGLYRPGSVFKLSVAAAALSSGLIDETYTFTCHGVYTYYTQREWGGALPGCANNTAHGTINIKQAIEVSCNCFFYDLGRRLGIDAINESAKKLGLGVTTGLELFEQEGRLSSPELAEVLGTDWYVGNVIQASIGQLDTAVTTVQLATYANTIANKGRRYQTHLVKSIVNYDGSETVYETPVNVVSEYGNTNGTFDIIEQGMIMASTEGNAKIYLSNLPYTVASKTGTAQVANDLYNSTMVAYGPVGNPEIAVAIVAEKGGNGYNLAYAVQKVFETYYNIKRARENGVEYGKYAEYLASQNAAEQPVDENAQNRENAQNTENNTVDNTVQNSTQSSEIAQ